MSLREQMLGEVRAVLPGDAGDECSPGQRILLAVSVAHGLTARGFPAVRVKYEVSDPVATLTREGAV
ncbi:hypothetical protein GCM10022214_59520 [Actinomadura miaoliensis]|uniref:Uncharacterized protein n=1 Tax=Actinomadura miaoliensis TaxID=430685 RepID=A0ABP7WK92_9ACTN